MTKFEIGALTMREKAAKAVEMAAKTLAPSERARIAELTNLAAVIRNLTLPVVDQ